MLARIPEVEAMVDRALELDESWGEGSLYEFQITFAGAKPGDPDFALIQKHFDRAQALSGGKRAGLYVAYSEAVSLRKQDGPQFRSLLEKSLALDPDQHESVRLVNLLAPRRARWLLSRADDLILPSRPPAVEGEPR